MSILIVEDDLALSDVIAFSLRRAGFEVATAYDGESALVTWEAERPDLVILDLNLPKLGGMGVLRQIRAAGETPVIILSVQGDDETIVKGLELGADDYVVKPFSPSQLIARIRAVLRRADLKPQAGPVTVGELELDRSRNEVRFAQEAAIRLTPLEVRLLETLMLNPGQVVTADQLIGAVWGIDGGDRSMLKQLVYRLRAKLVADTTTLIYLETVPGVGYTLTENRS